MIFFQNSWKRNAYFIYFDQENIRDFLKLTDSYILIFTYLFLTYISKLKKKINSNIILLIICLPLIIKLSFTFSLFFLLFIITPFLIRIDKHNRTEILFISILIFLMNIYFTPYAMLEFRSSLNFIHEGVFSVTALLSEKFASDFNYTFNITRTYLPSLIPFKIFGISVDVLSYSILFCKLILLNCLILVFYLLGGFKLLYIFIILLLTNYFNFLPTDFTAPWTHEFKVLPLYLFLLNILFAINFKNKNTLFFLGLALGFYMLSGIDYVQSLILIFVFFSIFFFRKNLIKNNINIYFKNNLLLINFYLINILIFSYIFLTEFFLISLSFSIHNLIFSIFSLLLIIFFSFFLISRLYFFSNFLFGLILILSVSTLSIYFSQGSFGFDLYSNWITYSKIAAGFDEIAKNYKDISSHLLDFFNTGIISTELFNTINNMSSYAQLNYSLNDKFAFINFSFYNFIYLYSHFIFFPLLLFYFVKNIIFNNSKPFEVTSIILIFITAIYSLSIFIKFYLLPDQQRFLLGIQFYHLSLFIFLFIFFKKIIFDNYKIVIIILLTLTTLPNLIFYKPSVYYNYLNQSNYKHFIYPTTLLGEISNNYKSLLLHDSDYYINNGSDAFLDIVEVTLGKQHWQHLSTQKKIFQKNFFQDKDYSPIFWDRSMIKNFNYLD